MVWFKVDDHLHSHPKAQAASLAAMGLWTLAGSWCADHLTDGVMPQHVVVGLSRGDLALADELVACGLWRRMRSGLGYRFHQWTADEKSGTSRNPTKQNVIEDRRRKAEAGRKGGLASGKARSKTQARASPVVAQSLNPRPDPLLLQSKEGRGSREREAQPLPKPNPQPHRDDGPPLTVFDDPVELAAMREEIRQQAESTSRARMDAARTTATGAAKARAAITRKPRTADPP